MVNAGFESKGCCVDVSHLVLCPSVCSGWSSFFVEILVSSSGETWQAKLIEILIIRVAQGWAVVAFGRSNICMRLL